MRDGEVDNENFGYMFEVFDDLRKHYIKMLCIIRDLYTEGMIFYPEDDPEFDIERNDNKEVYPDEVALEILFTRLEFNEIMEREFADEQEQWQ